MKSSKKQQANTKSRIRGNHQQKKGPVFIYLIVFVSVSIVMITLNQTRKRNLERGPNGQITTKTSDKSNIFNKEGELDFLNADNNTITSINIEIADDDLQTQRGLMYRRTMKDNHGMLFIFPDEEERSFWMKNTFLSLDIIYLNTNKEIVSIIESAQAKSEESLFSQAPAKYVVEVNAGFVAQHLIKVGDKIDFKRVFN